MLLADELAGHGVDVYSRQLVQLRSGRRGRRFKSGHPDQEVPAEKVSL